MRIISGYLKGKSFHYIKNFSTRPLKDYVKENIFNILKHSKLIDVKIKNEHVLDLYSGVGSFGLECISREAENVTFIENNLKTVEVLKKNLDQLFIADKAKILSSRIENVLKKNLKAKFNIFF